ncbi:2-oxoglutarate dehydrogenase E1 component [anaerobic digester metagenome]
MDNNTYLSNITPQALEELFATWKKDASLVDPTWQKFFEGFEFALAHYSNGQSMVLDAEFKVINLIESYRKRGHLFTKTNPVRTRRKYSPTLDIENFGLTSADMDTTFQAGKQIGIGPSKLSDIISHLEKTYCQSIGAEYMFIRDTEVVAWLQEKMESTQNNTTFSPEQKRHIFHHLKQAIGFEQFIHKKFIGQKRFSLEGAESLIPAMDAAIERGAELGIKEFVIGMAHRGRLNVLANIMQKPEEKIFSEFAGEQYEEDVALGDVKYHLGYSTQITTDKGNEVMLNLLPNPSHLETVGPVAEGVTRARANTLYGKDFNKIAPIIIHGDAAIAAQGVVYETIQMSQLKGYKTGGTIHLVINNQVGFTTNYIDARSSTYSTDIAKVTKSPIFHVNGDNPEALVHTIRLAMDYRQKFHTDVFIDILCYRRYGHNEGDEPRFTQPTLYEAITKHKNTRDLYTLSLAAETVLSDAEAKELILQYDSHLEEKLTAALAIKRVSIQRFLPKEWASFRYSQAQDFDISPSTAVSQEKLVAIAKKINQLPENTPFLKKLRKLIEDRQQMVDTSKLDWAMAELLAYGSLVDEGVPVRISGQDSERGTFSHRHAVYAVENSDEKYFPLKHISPNQAPFHVYNSHLSEYGVLGFEYGYSLAMPNGLTIWEAQFGDFHNVAQPIIDQYISSAEDKWGLQSGLTLLLPHGFEGQGPEHSSARVERFLTMAARNNMQLVNCTTPANMFHVLRRQVKRSFRVPLVVFTPKSLLRHPLCVSSLNEFTQNSFREVINDTEVDAQDVKRVVFCTGKVYYDLLQRKQHFEARDIALVRIEQLYPFPTKQVEAVLKGYPNALKWLWVQEEPKNMGAWNFIRDRITTVPIEPVTRAASGSPAVGLSKIHTMEQEEIIGKVFRKCDCELKNKYCGLQCLEGSKQTDRKSQHELL